MSAGDSPGRRKPDFASACCVQGYGGHVSEIRFEEMGSDTSFSIVLSEYNRTIYSPIGIGILASAL
jgi:hypothetical protein